ncbi:hypothetical protein KWH02_13105 [Xanthomonas campestris pv. uppalii]|uniref:hypothetical protein n=1 Tax=Xanthomonas euvesicatoria TaxID=456327 RepID=UPI001C482645|nr:hypothetical protein [Xanthomonas euvesicatoria]MBV6786112.1 hypothetical protein [Xanthomonas campestris pv. uppalii]
MSKFSTKFYRVTHCGYYRHGGHTAEIGDMEYFLSELSDWAATKSLEDTRAEGSGDRLTAYLFDIKHYGGCWVVVLWNEVPADAGAVASVPANAPVGGATALANPVAANSIPGFPTYFLFIPDDDLVAPLVYGDSVLGLQQFKYYAYNFLENSTSAVNFEELDDDVTILGYEDDDGEVHANLRPRFDIQLKRGGRQTEAIIQRATSIRSIIRVAEVNTIAPPDRARFQKFLDFFNLTAEPAAKKVRIRQEIPVTVTQQQVREMIESLGDDIIPKRNDLAFKFERDSKPYWLSGGIPTGTYEVPVNKAHGVFPADELARAFSRRKAAVIGDANP